MQLAAFGGAKLGLNILDVGGEAMELPATLYVSAMVVCKILQRGFPLGNWLDIKEGLWCPVQASTLTHILPDM